MNGQAPPYYDRIMARIQKQDDGCWLWTGGNGGHTGYGKAYLPDGTKSTTAHRAVYMLLVGPIPTGMVLDHLCRVRLCVNPDHLEPVTQIENNRRAAALITHCPQGHAYTAENLLPRKEGWRWCRACHKDRDKIRRARQREERRAARELRQAAS